MVRARLALLSAAVLVLVTGASAFAEDYNLSKVPVMKVGDRFTAKAAGQAEVTVMAEDGETLVGVTKTGEATEIHEILTVDAAGKPTQVRFTVSGSREVTELKTPQQARKVVTIADVTATAKPDGLVFAADTASLASGQMKTLTAPQISLVKDHFSDSMIVTAFPEPDVLLMPAGPVSIGAAWKVTEDVLNKWAKSREDYRRMKVTPKSGECKLDSVSGDVATVSGTVRLTLSDDDVAFETVAKLAGRIDLKSGYWRGATTELTATARVGPNTLKIVSRQRVTIEHQPGTGTVSKLPAELNKLGWPAPDKDVNSYRDPAAGVSLDLPKDYQDAPIEPGVKALARFSSPRGVSVVLAGGEQPLPLELDETGQQLLGQFKALPDFKLVSRDPAALPGNVPAGRITLTFNEGQFTMMVRYAVDGNRLVSVIVVAPTGDAGLASEARKITDSLRVFDQDYTQAK